jgi:hypothetical protein
MRKRHDEQRELMAELRRRVNTMTPEQRELVGRIRALSPERVRFALTLLAREESQVQALQRAVSAASRAPWAWSLLQGDDQSCP